MTVDHPAALALLPLAAAASVLYIMRMTRALSWGNELGKRPALCLGAVLRAAAGVLVAMALAGIHGREPQAQRNNAMRGQAGDAVSLVFDISYSMNALDAGGQYQVSRLDAASLLCSMLLPSMRGVPISVVLAKGDGVVAVPLTEDQDTVEQCLNALSPALMSSAGTNLGAGIQAAESTFPDDVAFARNIWLFTDGDETAGSLAHEVERAVRGGSAVVLVGVGSTDGAEVTAGDGKTRVHTALKEDALKGMASASTPGARAQSMAGGNVRYIAAAQNGAASMLLATLTGQTGNAQSSADERAAMSGDSVLALAAVVLFVMSILVTQVHFPARAISVLLLSSVLVGCSSKSATRQTISGAWAWHQGRMQRAAASFVRALQFSRDAGDDEGAQYALYNIAAAYIAMNEYDAALSRMDEVAEDAPLAVRYAAAYNRGVVEMSRGEYDKAVTAFRQALLADNSSIAAKENLEIANDALHQTTEMERDKASTPSDAASAPPDQAAQAMFDRVREQDKKQWKAREQTSAEPNSADY